MTVFVRVEMKLIRWSLSTDTVPHISDNEFYMTKCADAFRNMVEPRSTVIGLNGGASQAATHVVS